MRGDVLRTVRSPVGGVAAVLGATFLLLCWVLRGFVTDDSWISVRYAENLAAGAGPVWNPGGPRAEGFSNPLLVYLEALAAAAGWDAMTAARTLGVVSGLACVLLVTLGARAVVGDAAAAVGGLLTAVSAPFALWSVGGLETTATALALTAGVLQLARPDGGRVVAAGAVLAVLPWLRPEGLVVALAVAGLAEGPGLLRRASRGRAVRRLAVAAGLPVASQALLEVVRLSVYGHLLPNSVLYKSGTGETFGVLLKFVGHSGLVVALAVVGTLLLRRRGLVLAVPALVYVAGSIGTKDSANSWSRFFMPVWPQLALLAAVALVAVAALVSRWLRRRPGGSGHPAGWDRVRPAAHAGAGGRVVVPLAVVTGVAVSLVLPGSLPEVESWQGRYMGCRVGAREDAARWLMTTPPGTLFAISDAGYVPARAGGRPAVDSFMLNDPLIQQTGPLSPSERADVVHERRPDVLVLASRDAERFDPVYPTDRAVREHPAAAAFTLRHVASGADCGYHLMLLAR
jgi:arabinofuranosyltransferase